VKEDLLDEKDRVSEGLVDGLEIAAVELDERRFPVVEVDFGGMTASETGRGDLGARTERTVEV
jgi:hypothetical protein